MPPVRRGPAPLTEADVARLQGDLATGAEPRVQLLVDTAAAPAGTRGPVVALRDAAVEPEFIVLRVGGDEVPFSPAELTWPVRGGRGRAGESGVPAPARSAAQPRSAAPTEPAGSAEAAGSAEPAGSAGSDEAGGPAEVAGPAEPAGPIVPPAVPDRAATTEPTSAEVLPTQLAPAEPAPTDPRPPAPADPAAPRPRRPRPAAAGGTGSQPFTVTLRFTGTDWTAETTRGGRRGKARAVPVAAVRGFAERLDDPELRRAVLTAVEACREQARARAERLRAELEQVETVLAQLDDED